MVLPFGFCEQKEMQKKNQYKQWNAWRNKRKRVYEKKAKVMVLWKAINGSKKEWTTKGKVTDYCTFVHTFMPYNFCNYLSKEIESIVKCLPSVNDCSFKFGASTADTKQAPTMPFHDECNVLSAI